MSERIKLPRPIIKILDSWFGNTPDVKAAKKNWKKLQECMPDDFLICCIACHQEFSKDNLVKPPDWYQAGICKGFSVNGNENDVSCLLHNEASKVLGNLKEE